VVEDVGLRGDDGLDRGAAAPEVRGEDLDAGRGREGPHRPDGFGEVPGPAVGQVVAVDRGEDDEPQLHRLDGAPDAERLRRIDRRGLAVGDVAEAAGSRTDVAEQEKRGGPAREALSAIGTARLLADRVQAVRAHHGLDGVQVGQAQPAIANPLGSAHRQRLAHIPSGTTQGDLTFSWRASLDAAFSASPSERKGPTRTR
jgi:hypothetical protein